VYDPATPCSLETLIKRAEIEANPKMSWSHGIRRSHAHFSQPAMPLHPMPCYLLKRRPAV
jgi:hypothetical protein